MDGERKSTKTKALALVAREFIPSRIECQLLTQVFELLSVPHGIDEAPAERTGVHAPAIASQFHGRRVAGPRTR
jgi:hypothetical protein